MRSRWRSWPVPTDGSRRSRTSAPSPTARAASGAPARSGRSTCRPCTARSVTSDRRSTACRSTRSAASSRTTRARCYAKGGSEILPGVYATGWIKRGPVGLIGHTKSDAMETIEHLVKDQANWWSPAEPSEAAVTELLESRGVEYTDPRRLARARRARAGARRAAGPRAHQGRRPRRDGEDRPRLAATAAPPSTAPCDPGCGGAEDATSTRRASALCCAHGRSPRCRAGPG